MNFVDTYQRRGVYPVDLPFVLGQEGIGRVLAPAPDAGEFAVGERVAWATGSGGYAEKVVVPAEIAVAVPDAVPDDVALGALLQGMTAHFLVTDCAPVRPQDTVLVHAAAGGVGLLLTQLATARGARVLGTVSTAAKEELARGAGAARSSGPPRSTTSQPPSATSPAAPASTWPSTGSAATRSTPAWRACAAAGRSCCSAPRAGPSPRSTRSG